MKISRITLMMMLFVMGIAVATFAGCSSGGSPTPDTGGLPPEPSDDGLPPEPSDDGLPPEPSDDGLPPEPSDDERDATVAGVDTNNNGVRDDVERALHARHPDMTPTMMSALMQNAKAYQIAVMAGVSLAPDAIDEAVREIGDAVACLDDRFGDAAYDELIFIEYTTVNTAARSDADIGFNDALSGQFFGAEQDNTCEQ